MWPFQKPSGFGLLASLTCSLFRVVVCVVQSPWFVPTGLVVHLLKPEVATKAQRGVEPLVVRVEFNGRSVIRNLYIGSRRIPSEAFATTLLKGLASRPPTWPVYVEGDQDFRLGGGLKVIDEVPGIARQSRLADTPSQMTAFEDVSQLSVGGHPSLLLDDKVYCRLLNRAAGPPVGITAYLAVSARNLSPPGFQRGAFRRLCRWPAGFLCWGDLRRVLWR